MSANVKELYREIKKEEEQKHVDRAKKNLSVLRSSTIPFKFESSGVVSVRDKAYPVVEFDPGTNRWFARGRWIMGDAQALIDWLWLQGPKRGQVKR